MFKTLKQALEYVGGVSKPGKMPCPSYSIPAQECNTGVKLQAVEGTVCSDCYALKGNYHRYAKNVLPALYRRLETLAKANWVAAMSFIVAFWKLDFFRWHDSGDVQNVNHFTKIDQVARSCETTQFWLPTREYSTISQYKELGGEIAENLVVRLSAYKIGQAPPTKIAEKLGVLTSTVGWEDAPFTCPAYKQGGKCLDCRACWSNIPNVNYPHH